MKAPSERDVKKLFALSLNQCAFPDCIASIFSLTDEMIGEICHIKAKSPEGPRYDPNQTDAERHSFDNLILFCRNHHKVVDDQPKKFTVEWLKVTKQNHEQNGVFEITQEDARLARKLLDSYLKIESRDEAQVMVNSPGSIQAKIFKASSKKGLPKGHPPGTIGADMDMHNYISYLVKRFNEFRRAAQKIYRERQSYPYSAIHTQIESIFDNPTYYVPQGRFGELAAFFKQRIDETPIGLRNQRNGIPSYYSFEKHQKISRGEK
jgi:hypothetical protein